MTEYIKTGDLSINTLTQEVSQKGEVLSLPHLSYQTMMLLINRYPQAVTFDELMEEVWQGMEVNMETVTQRIALLRKSLSLEQSQQNAYIASVRSVGYRWVPEISTVKSKPQQNIGINKVIVGCVVLLVLVCVAFLYQHKTTDNSLEQPALIKLEASYKNQAFKYLQKHDLNSNQLALGLFRKALSNEPNDTEAMIGVTMALYHQVTKFNQSDELLQEAELLAQRVTESDSKNAKAWTALALVYDAKGEINLAIQHFEKALELDPQDLSAISSLAYLYGLKGNLVEALKMNISQLQTQSFYVDLQTASTLELLGFDRVAEFWYRRADELNPDSVFATHQRARHLMTINQWQQAKVITEQAIARGVKRPELYVNLGLIEWIENGFGPTARQHFLEAIEVDEHHFEANIWAFISQTNPSTAAQAEFEQQWFSQSVPWPDMGVHQAVYDAYFGQAESAINHIKTAYTAGYRNYRWLNLLPPLANLKQNSEFQQLVSQMQNDIGRQRDTVLDAEWLPTSFLDPKNY
ncbi:MAG: winged helix-turn-helix domain-containing protein [Xanthomonadales bacterium]|nr:winged helix-turn-helix domain-containing protein [Xanthomonadales bacterium]